MDSVREIAEILPAQPTREGAGVRLKRGIGFDQVPRFDPFLLLDDIHSTHPEDYLAGFPWHPHRGIETVTYVLQGDVEHGDSIGNRGAIHSGDVQWMTAGSGIVHQEMPRPWTGDMRGLQLWVNLPRSHKLMEPRYRDVPAAAIPRVECPGGALVNVVAGAVEGVQGPVRDIVRAPEYLDVTLPAGAAFDRLVPEDHTAFAYLLTGSVGFGGGAPVAPDHVVRFGRGELVRAHSPHGGRFLLISGEPLGEPVAWRGPIVMNTQAELDLAFREYRDGTFLKAGRAPEA